MITDSCDIAPESSPLLPSPCSPSPAVPSPASIVLANESITGRRSGSAVWPHFRKASDYTTSWKVTCMHCKGVFTASKGSTTSLRAHLEKRHYVAFAMSIDANGYDSLACPSPHHPFA